MCAQHVELRDEAGAELRFRGVAQLARTVEPLARDADERLLRHDAVVRRGHVHGDLLLEHRLLARRVRLSQFSDRQAPPRDAGSD